MPVIAGFVFPIFVFLLPLFMVLLLVPGSLSADETWLLRFSFLFLMPLSSVMWFVVVHRLVTRRRSRYFHQFLVLVATAVLMFMLISVGIYRIG